MRSILFFVGLLCACQTEPPQSPTRLTFPSGEERIYTLSWRTDATLPLPGLQATETTTRLEGDVGLRAQGTRDGVTRLLLRFVEVRAEEVRVGGREMIPQEKQGAARAALVGQEALLTLDERGFLRAVHFREATPPEIRDILVKLAAALRYALPRPSAPAEEVFETDAVGTFRARYSWAKPGTLQRKRLAYTEVPSLTPFAISVAEAQQELRGGTTIRFDAQGALHALDDHMALAVQTPKAARYSVLTSLSMALRRKERFDPASVRAEELAHAHVPRVIPRDAAFKYRQLARDMSPEKLRLVIESFGRGAPLADGFIVEAAAYLRLHPEESAALAARFPDPALTPRARGLLVDALTSAGDAAAQRALRQVLATPEARRDPESFGFLLARFPLLRRPDRESVQYLLVIYDLAKVGRDALVKHASAVALGGLVRRLRGNGEHELAERCHTLLRRELEQPPSPEQPTRAEDQLYLLRALGNAAVPADTALIASFARDPRTEVRDQVAHSLRDLDGPLARETLLALAQDGSRTVATTALRAMRRQTTGIAEWRRLRALVEAGKTTSTADSALVDLIGAQRAQAGAHGEALLRFVAARAGRGDPHLRDAARDLLATSRSSP